jgi:hypothetical protein
MGNFHNMVLTYMEPKYGQVQYIDLVGLWSFNSTFNNIPAISKVTHSESCFFQVPEDTYDTRDDTPLTSMHLTFNMYQKIYKPQLSSSSNAHPCISLSTICMQCNYCHYHCVQSSTATVVWFHFRLARMDVRTREVGTFFENCVI